MFTKITAFSNYKVQYKKTKRPLRGESAESEQREASKRNGSHSLYNDPFFHPDCTVGSGVAPDLRGR
jgi:hypothetical protein